MNRITKNLTLTASLITLAALTACGGGGGGGSSSSNSGAEQELIVAVSTSGTLRQSVPASTYTPASINDDAFAAVNAMRDAGGAGLVAQSANADTASQKHADYLAYTADQYNQGNITSPSDLSAYTDLHTEYTSLTTGQPAVFYAATLSERVALAYGASQTRFTEIIAGASSGAVCVTSLANTVYHLNSLMSPSTEVGVSVYLDEGGNNACQVTLVQTSTYGQTPATGAVIAFPYDGATVPGLFQINTESPRPASGLVTGPNAGHPVLVSARNADYVNAVVNGSAAVEISTFTVTDNLGGAVPAAVLAGPNVTIPGSYTGASDSRLGEGVAVLVPQSALSAGTYTVTYVANLKTTVRGVVTNRALTKTFTFTAQ